MAATFSANTSVLRDQAARIKQTSRALAKAFADNNRLAHLSDIMNPHDVDTLFSRDEGRRQRTGQSVLGSFASTGAANEPLA